jgi:ABC-type transporter Mla MlaB component
MPSEVGHLVDSGQAYPVVRLTGVLDAETAATVRSALVGVLALGPEALVVDVSDLKTDSSGMAVLRDVARENEDWPAAHLVLCCSHAEQWRFSGLPVWPSAAEAFAALGAPDPDSHLTMSLEPVVGAARRARELVTEACGRWDLPELAGGACIVVTEMVNNVVAHAQTSMSVLLARHGQMMSVAVRDHSSARPRFNGPVAPTSYGGRGLLLIDSVARRWGNLGLVDGKVVWALLDSEDESPEAARSHLNSAGMPGPARG